MRVWVCTWEPEHTLRRADAIVAATASGLIRSLAKEFGADQGALSQALREAGLVSVYMRDELPVCPDCAALMDEVLSRDGIERHYDAIVDVVQDFDAAIDRTRRAKMRGEF